MLYKIEAAIGVGLTGSTPTELPFESNETFVRNNTGLPVADVNLYLQKLHNLNRKSSFYLNLNQFNQKQFVYIHLMNLVRASSAQNQ